MERLCYSLLGVKWKICRGIHWATSVGLRRPIAERQRETVRKLSPYDVFPPSQRRFRRDTRGSQESCVSVGVMENRRKRAREQPTPRKRKRKRESERRRVCETLSLLLYCICVWHHAYQGDFAGVECLNGLDQMKWSFLYECHYIYLSDISLSCSIVHSEADYLYKNNCPRNNTTLFG